MRGATVVRGTMGFGGHSEIHSRKNIQDSISIIGEVLHKGMATVEDVDTSFFGDSSA